MSLSECIGSFLWLGGEHAGSADMLAGLYNTTPPASGGRRRRRRREEKRRERADTHTPFWVHESCSCRRRNRSYLIACSKHKSHTQTKWERSWRTRKCVLLWLNTRWGRDRGRTCRLWTQTYGGNDTVYIFHLLQVLHKIFLWSCFETRIVKSAIQIHLNVKELICPLLMCFILNIIQNYTLFYT